MASRVYGHSAVEENSNSEAAARDVQEITDVQHMIDINSEHLERLRTPMTSTSGRKMRHDFHNFQDCIAAIMSNIRFSE